MGSGRPDAVMSEPLLELHDPVDLLAVYPNAVLEAQEDPDPPIAVGEKKLDEFSDPLNRRMNPSRETATAKKNIWDD